FTSNLPKMISMRTNIYCKSPKKRSIRSFRKCGISILRSLPIRWKPLSDRYKKETYRYISCRPAVDNSVVRGQIKIDFKGMDKKNGPCTIPLIFQVINSITQDMDSCISNK